MPYKFKCPFCFFDCTDDTVVFRANTGFSADHFESQPSGGGLFTTSTTSTPSSGNSEAEELFRFYDRESDNRMNKKLDTKLIDFWGKRGGSVGYEFADKKWNYPHIEPGTPDFFKMISLEPKGPFKPNPEDGFVRDEDGFIDRVLDKLSDPSQRMDRLCPSCHNPLPINKYGKFPIIFISVVGITSSGKSVYLIQLLNNFVSSMQNNGYRIGESNIGTIGEEVRKGRPLPKATDDKVMRRPLAINMLKDTGNHMSTKEGITLVFYDVAGENCVDSVDEFGAIRDDSAIANFIGNCDGMMFLIDPQQIPIYAPAGIEADEDNIKRIRDVVNKVLTIRNIYSQSHSIPVAVALTKSDTLTDVIHDPNNLIFQQSDPSARFGFNREEFFKIHSSLKSEFLNKAHSVEDDLTSFPLRAYFAVSAITCGVEQRFEMYQNQYSLNELDERKLKSLRRWIVGWNSRDAVSRGYYESCPIRQQNGEPITVPIDRNIDRDLYLNDVVTEIKASNVRDPSAPEIYLTMGQVLGDINLVSYPVGNPNPRRLAEPVQWILWQLSPDISNPFARHYLEPSPRFPETPKKGFLMSEKRYQALLDEYQQTKLMLVERFYSCEDLRSEG